MIVSCDASSKFHKRRFQNERFTRGFFKFSQISASKTQSLTTPGQCAEQFLQLKICISPQFRAIDPPNPTRGLILQNQNVRLATTACHPKFQNARFATAACAKMYESNARRPRQPAPYKNHHFTTVSGFRPARSDERVARATSKFAFHHSFGRPTSRKRRKGCATTQRIFACHHSFGRPTTTK